MARELITKNKTIKEKWMYTVSANADGMMSCSPAAYRHFALIGSWCLSKKVLGLFFLWQISP
jgi:hypothetical protein